MEVINDRLPMGKFGYQLNLIAQDEFQNAVTAIMV